MHYTSTMITIITPLRGKDAFGDGAYGAPRGTRTHKGQDVAAYAGSLVLPPEPGVVSKIGYPYDPNDPKKGHLRYVEIITGLDYRLRFFYIEPLVCMGEKVIPTQPIGAVADLQAVYGADMTNHVHVEVIRPDGSWMDPKHYF